MSEMIFKFGDKFENLPPIIAEYDTILQQAEENLTLKNKSLEIANREQPSWYCYYNQKLQEIKSLHKLIENKTAHQKGVLWRKYTETANIQLKATDLEHYINADKDYITHKTYLIVVEELVGMFTSLVKAFEARGYALRNITDSRINEIQNAVLM